MAGVFLKVCIAECRSDTWCNVQYMSYAIFSANQNFPLCGSSSSESRTAAVVMEQKNHLIFSNQPNAEFNKPKKEKKGVDARITGGHPLSLRWLCRHSSQLLNHEKSLLTQRCDLYLPFSAVLISRSCLLNNNNEHRPLVANGTVSTRARRDSARKNKCKICKNEPKN